MLRKIVLLTLIYMIILSAGASASVWQDLPDGICSRYAAQEFNKIAPSPGFNWNISHLTWVDPAKWGGWVVKTDPKDAMVGAIVEWEVPSAPGGHVAIVRMVLTDKIIVEEQNSGTQIVSSFLFWIDGTKYRAEKTENWGKATITAIKYDEIDKRGGGKLKFHGYIWPVRQADFDKDPAKYSVTPVEEPYYKGYREYHPAVFMLKEFDKVAPAPGANWKGSTLAWIDNANKAGWVTKLSPSEAMSGALMVWADNMKNLVKVGIVREVRPDGVVFDSRYSNLLPYTMTLSFEEIKQAKDGLAFSGYIWPVRIQ